jgi:hypothetical protein
VDAPAPEPAPEADEKIEVTKASFKIITGVLRGGQNTAQVNWNNWVKAMVDAGFKARNIGGSPVSFEAERRSIVFHRPHPEGKMASFLLETMGKR